jgi:hypothetical protein
VKKARELINSLFVVEVARASASSMGKCRIDWGTFKPLER